MNPTSKNILFLLPYPLHRAPSQRFRVENLLFLLDESEIDYHLAPFITDKTWQILYKQGQVQQKVWSVLKSFMKRWFVVLFKAFRYKIIFIHREAAPIGPPLIEWFLVKVLQKKIVYDFDDAIWIPNTSAQNKIASAVKSFWKVKYICKWSYKISAGNDYLCDYARLSGAKNINRIPTVVNTEKRYNRLKIHHENHLTIGWTGSHSTLKFLEDLLPIVRELQVNYDFTFLIIADKKPEINLNKWIFCPWNEQTEIEDLLKIDIGVMPLIDDAWSEGKCGFKLIQYLSLGIPAVASPVGVNKKIIDNDINGILANDDSQWKKALETLLLSRDLRTKMGKAGREKMIREYSISAQKNNFIALFQ